MSGKLIFTHRRQAIFCRGEGGGGKLPKFLRNSWEEKRAMQKHRPYWHMKLVARYSFSGSIPAKFEHKQRRHKQTFGKIATTVVLEKDENLS